MFTRKKAKRTIEDLDKFLNIADQSLLVFEEGVLYEDVGLQGVENINCLQAIKRIIGMSDKPLANE